MRSGVEFLILNKPKQSAFPFRSEKGSNLVQKEERTKKNTQVYARFQTDRPSVNKQVVVRTGREISSVQSEAYNTAYFEKHLLVPGCGTEAPPTPHFTG